MGSRGIKQHLKPLPVLCSLLALWILFGHLFTRTFSEYKQGLSSAVKEAKINGDANNGVEKLVIATVACSANKNDNTIYEEAAVMIKSVVLSAQLHNNKNLKKQIVFYIFLEYPERQIYFENKFKEYGLSSSSSSNGSLITTHFRTAVDVVPAKYRSHMIYHPRFRCSYVRSFFPTALPNEDAVLYLDTDVIITGDIYKLWSLFNQMGGGQLIGIGNNNEVGDTHYKAMDMILFGDIPHVQPKGVNNGVILMNLTKMREYEWEDKFTKLYDAYSKFVKNPMTVQRLMNILLFYNPGLTCNNIQEDPVGIHLIHGANNMFGRNRIFRNIFENYKMFNMTHGDVLADLMIPIKNSYKSESIPNDLCNKVLSENLFKHIT